jgi:biopolymer transport protein ExbD
MKFKKTEEEDVRVGITPLIDVVFLLLIFFMLTSQFHIASGVKIRLPKITNKAFESAEKKIVLVVDRNSRIFFEGKELKLDKLEAKLTEIIKQDGAASLVLEADKQVTHGKVVNIMDISKKAGVSSIIIAAKWDPEKVF